MMEGGETSGRLAGCKRHNGGLPDPNLPIQSFWKISDAYMMESAQASQASAVTGAPHSSTAARSGSLFTHSGAHMRTYT